MAQEEVGGGCKEKALPTSGRVAALAGWGWDGGRLWGTGEPGALKTPPPEPGIFIYLQ